MFKSIPLGSPIPLVYNFLGNGFPLGSPSPLVYNIKPLGLLVLLVYNMNNRSMSSMIKRRIMTTIVSMFKSIRLGSPIPLVSNLLGNGFPLGSPIALVYNIKPLGLLVFLVYNMNNRSISSLIKCHIMTNIVSI